MLPEYINGNVRARCSDCSGALSTFESRHGGKILGKLISESGSYSIGDESYQFLHYVLLRCADCGRGGLAQLFTSTNTTEADKGKLGSFHPTAIETLPIPDSVPDGIAAEFREAERCASVGAWRAASAMLRSTLEKVLKDSVYINGMLFYKIKRQRVTT